ncbi:hypothetical protein [Fusobacterium perfoetens]|nr:hypothetical protein [Fusobacterium perfoetens]
MKKMSDEDFEKDFSKQITLEIKISCVALIIMILGLIFINC